MRNDRKTSKSKFLLTDWKPQFIWNQTEISESLYEWIVDPDSMTNHLQQVCQESFSVQLLFQDWKEMTTNERSLLNLRDIDRAVVREVNLLCDQKAWLFGRTVFPAITWEKQARLFHSLGERPLGEVLFQQKDLKRSEFQFALLERGELEFEQAIASLNLKNFPEKLWARRSIFYVNQYPLLLTEVFLPEMMGVLRMKTR